MTTPQRLVDELVTLLAPHLPDGPVSLAERAHAALWPLVQEAVKKLPAEEKRALTPQKSDKRTRLWQYVVRFWLVRPTGPELVAETDPEIMEGTGSLPRVVRAYAQELHGRIPTDLSDGALRALLPQMRNNLGRSASTSLRVPYTHGDDAFLCQFDITRLEG